MVDQARNSPNFDLIGVQSVVGRRAYQVMSLTPDRGAHPTSSNRCCKYQSFLIYPQLIMAV